MHFVAVDVKSTRMIVDQAFLVPKCVRLTRKSEKSYELLCKIFSAVPENKGGVGINTGKEVHGIREWELRETETERINRYRLQYSRRE